MRRALTALLFAAGLLGLGVMYSPPVAALDIPCDSDNPGQCNLVTTKTPLTASIWNVIGVALGILGGIAVIVVVIAGLMYTTSGGDASKVSAAKTTILYAIVGLVVALSAAGIVAFISSFFK